MQTSRHLLTGLHRTRSRFWKAFLGRDPGSSRSQESRKPAREARPNTHNTITLSSPESIRTRAEHPTTGRPSASATQRRLLVTLHGRATLPISRPRQEPLSHAYATCLDLDIRKPRSYTNIPGHGFAQPTPIWVCHNHHAGTSCRTSGLVHSKRHSVDWTFASSQLPELPFHRKLGTGVRPLARNSTNIPAWSWSISRVQRHPAYRQISDFRSSIHLNDPGLLP